ncbi:peroxiredoxin [Sphingomonas sp. SUN039]|uniref:peroxiredoxin n=1 Tax=Sphingomonas sp. SUN039 TaxID=2937787 RepID=UPI002164E955|nr:peroxiredoxin [Sphingomonas sp. SUN039]UVO54442.1 peroxiredoxin [Sphingomonas sp. SUN039]
MTDVGSMAPDAAFDLADGTRSSIAAYRGKPLVLYFYPKDDTPGCTNEAKAFSALMPDFAKAGVAVVGASKDSVKSHAKFIAKYDLKVALAADADGSLCEAFGTWVEKSMYGRQYMGIERATFLIEADGRIAAVWRKVKVPGHAESVLAAATALTA